MSNLLYVASWVLAVGLGLLFFYVVYEVLLDLRNRQIRNVDLGELIPSFLPVDVEALAGLINPADENGSGVDDQLDESQRVRRTIIYLRRMTHNAALLQRLGYSQLHSPNQLICDLAQQMIDAGVYVRLYTLLGLATLHTWTFLSFVSGPLKRMRWFDDVEKLLSSDLIPSYETLKTKAGNLTCLKFSSLHEELAQSL